MSNKDGVWILGNNVDGVEKCIDWYVSDIPNFADCNVLIVDMTTLSTKTLHSRDFAKCKEIFEGILARYKTGLQIYCILSESFQEKTYENYDLENYFWCPIRFRINKTKPAKTWTFYGNFGFDNYMKYMDTWNLVIDLQNTSPTSDWNSFWGHERLKRPTLILSHSNEIIGGFLVKI